MVSIVIPTYNEGENVFRVTRRIMSALGNQEFEIVFVDDSTDDSGRLFERLPELFPSMVLHWLHRNNERGLGTAVVEGIRKATHDFIVVLDADLQHPPEMIPSMIQALNQGADIVIPSRFVPGGSDGGLSPLRKLASTAARWTAKITLPRIRLITDPTSGFFAFRRTIVDVNKLHPIGWKILLEILVKGDYQQVKELPYSFATREKGASKFSMKEQWNYLRHLIQLIRHDPRSVRPFLFAAIGATGVAVNTGAYLFSLHVGVSPMVSSAVAAIIAMISNFVLNDEITWRTARRGMKHMRALKFFATSCLGVLINLILLNVGLTVWKLDPLWANWLGIGMASIGNYLVSNYWTWKSNSEQKEVIV